MDFLCQSTVVTIYMKKLLHFDWLRAVQFKCNTSANDTFVILECDWLKDNGKFSKAMISLTCKVMIKILCRKFVKNFEKKFSWMRKNDFKKDLQAFAAHDFFSCLYYTYQKVIIQFFSFKLELICTLHVWVVQKAQIIVAEVALGISAFWKTHKYKLIPNWIQNLMITYTKLNWTMLFILLY